METNPAVINFPETTTHESEDLDVTSDVGPNRTQLPHPPRPSSSQPLTEDRYHGWMDMTSHQLLHVHSWHVPKQSMENYMKAHTNDPEVCGLHYILSRKGIARHVLSIWRTTKWPNLGEICSLVARAQPNVYSH